MIKLILVAIALCLSSVRGFDHLSHGDPIASMLLKDIYDNRIKGEFRDFHYSREHEKQLGERKLTTVSIISSDLSILRVMFLMMGGNNWDWKTPYESYGIPWNFSDPFPCRENSTWQGIQCTCTVACVVTHIVLPGLNLQGSIPVHIGYFPYLGYLDLSDNSVSGSIPLTMGSLTNLHFKYNLKSREIVPVKALDNFSAFKIIFKM